jgi:hypothetical protein
MIEISDPAVVTTKIVEDFVGKGRLAREDLKAQAEVKSASDIITGTGINPKFL